MTVPAVVDPPRIGPGLEGRAVYLAHVVDWLMGRHEVSREAAWGRVLEALAGPAPCAVYGMPAGATGYGQPFVRDEWFATIDGAPRPAGGRRILSRGIGCDTPKHAQATSLGPGYTGFVAWLRGVVKSANFDASTGYAARLAVAESEARRLWGWGVEAVATPVADAPTDWDGLVASFKGRRKGAPWSDTERAILRAGFNLRNGWRHSDDGRTWVKDSAVQEAMARELGMHRQALDRHLGDGPDTAASAFSAMGNTLTGTR